MRRHILSLGILLIAGCAALTPPHVDLPESPATAIPPAPEREQIVRAVCIGLNSVDPMAWGGWSGELDDCEFDATFAAEMWGEHGIDTQLLLTRNATISICRDALKYALHDMKAGDMLIVWLSGHGGRENDLSGDENDGLDEYVCLYDGPLTDDTINSWLEFVPEGVRILWICDTCHSGTMYRSKPVRFAVGAIPSQFRGELILLAGCAEDKYSLSTGQGGMWSVALQDTGPERQSPKSWFEAAKAKIPASQQIPVYAEYGKVSDDFRNAQILRGGNQ